MLLWTLGYMYLLLLIFSCFSYVYPGVKILGHVVVQVLVFWETSIWFFTRAAPIYIATDSVGGLFFSPYPYQNFFFVVFLMTAIMTGGFGLHFPNDQWRWAPSQYLVAICMCSLEKCLFKSSYWFLSRSFFFFFFLVLCYMSSLNILGLVGYIICKHRLPFSRWPFVLLDSFLCYAKAF